MLLIEYIANIMIRILTRYRTNAPAPVHPAPVHPAPVHIAPIHDEDTNKGATYDCCNVATDTEVCRYMASDEDLLNEFVKNAESKSMVFHMVAIVHRIGRGETILPLESIKDIDKASPNAVDYNRGRAYMRSSITTMDNGRADATTGSMDDVKSVGLFGSCGPSRWRQDIAIPMLAAAGVSYFNPVVDNWTSDCMAIEAYHKDHDTNILLVIDRATLGIASMVEAAFLIGKKRPNMVFVVDELRMSDFPAVDADDIGEINSARRLILDLARKENYAVYGTVKAAIESLTLLSTIQQRRRGGFICRIFGC